MGRFVPLLALQHTDDTRYCSVPCWVLILGEAVGQELAHEITRRRGIGQPEARPSQNKAHSFAPTDDNMSNKIIQSSACAEKFTLRKTARFYAPAAPPVLASLGEIPRNPSPHDNASSISSKGRSAASEFAARWSKVEPSAAARSRTFGYVHH